MPEVDNRPPMDNGGLFYTFEGYRVDVLAKIDEGFVVRDVCEEDDCVYVGNSIRIEKQVFTNPPVAQYEEKIQALRAEHDALKSKRNELAKALNIKQAEHDKRMAKFAKYDALKQLEDFIDGKITHYVTICEWTRRVSIIAFRDAISKYPEYPKELRLLTLYGKSDGNLRWHLNSYSRGPGNEGIEVILCCSLDEANTTARRVIEAIVQEQPDKPYQALIESASALGIDIPLDYVQQFQKNKRDDITKRIESIQRDLSKAQAELDA